MLKSISFMVVEWARREASDPDHLSRLSGSLSAPASGRSTNARARRRVIRQCGTAFAPDTPAVSAALVLLAVPAVVVQALFPSAQ